MRVARRRRRSYLQETQIWNLEEESANKKCRVVNDNQASSTVNCGSEHQKETVVAARKRMIARSLFDQESWFNFVLRLCLCVS